MDELADLDARLQQFRVSDGQREELLAVSQSEEEA